MLRVVTEAGTTPCQAVAMIGDVPNVEVGQEFSTRRQAHEAGVHRPLQAGICGTKKTGAESIVVSGGYKDDEDYGDVIVYTGHGGQNGAGKQVSDQTLDDSGNAALVTSYLEGLPVRVLRGYQAGTPYAPASGYRYDGLYRVTNYGSKLGIDGRLIWQFRLKPMTTHPRPRRRSSRSSRTRLPSRNLPLPRGTKPRSASPRPCSASFGAVP